MENDVLKMTIEAFIKVYADDAKSLFGDVVNKGKQFVNSGLRKYLEKHQNKYSYIKTILHGNTPRYLYDIYYPLRIYLSDTTFKKTDNISNLFSANINCVSIIGEAGSGKSTLVKHLFLNSIKNSFAIPILIELRYLNEINGDLEAYIYDILLEEDIAIDGDLVKRLLRKGKFLFFLDGFDELNSGVKPASIKNINGFINKYHKNKFILTSRPKADAEYLPQFHNYRIGKLDTLQDIFGFIKKQYSDEEELANNIIESIEKGNHVYIFSFLSNPLILSLYILGFHTNTRLPEKKYRFYERVVHALFAEHDSKLKMGFKRERLSNLDEELIEELLCIFCLYTFFENKYEWDKDFINKILRNIKQLESFKDTKIGSENLIKDLVLGISLWLEDGGIYAFAHRTIQEFYVAKFIKNLKTSENHNFYSLLIQKYILTGNHPYLLSLFSFLEDMDTFNFKKSFKLPLLEKLETDFENKNKEAKILYYLNYFGYSYQGSNVITKTRTTGISQTIEKYVLIIKKEKNELRQLLNDVEETESLLFENSFNDSFDFDDEIDLQSDLEEKFSITSKKGKFIFPDEGDFINEHILPRVDRLLKQIRKEIKELRSSIAQTEKVESDIINILSRKDENRFLDYL